MSQILLISLSFCVGIMVVIQGGLNAKLGGLLNNSLLATSAALSMSAIFTIITVVIYVKEFPSIQLVRSVPIYLWVTGALFSFMAVTLFYYLIPKLGLSTAVHFSLCGQIVFSTIAAHFGWFGLPEEPVILKKLIGIIAMLSGLALIKF